MSVYTILKKLISELKMLVPDIRRIHYLTDSPTSQYRNKSIFRLILTHKEEFGVQARWNYLESGHGKGPCDGLGASVKRSADNAIKHGKASIQNASDFFSYAQKTMEEGSSKVKYIYYTQEDYDEAKSTLDAKTLIQAVQGTFKIHYVVAINPMQIYTRNVSCYGQQCIDDVTQSNCEGYTNHCLTMREKKNKDQIDPNQQDKSKENENAQKEMEHISENVDDNDKQQSLERNKVNAEENGCRSSHGN